ncbi:MAG: DUF488 domain-containing protein [Candidatus Paceibacterota bacterium]
MLFTKCIFHKKSPADGIRISVMSRHTLNDGALPDSRITSSVFDEHIPQLGPAPKLIGAYYRHFINWNDFEAQYRSQIRIEPCKSIVEKLAKCALTEDITLLCVEDKPDHCHRRILAEECKIYIPELVIEHH